MNKKFKVSKWIMLSIAALLNAFIIFYSCVNSETTESWNAFVTNVFSTIINAFTQKEVKTIPVTDITISFSDETTNKYNYLPGYGLEEIPLGSAKQIECNVYPSDATNKSVSFYTNDKDVIVLNQSGSTVLVVGMQTGEATVYVKNADLDVVRSVSLTVVDIVEPVDFEISLENNEIAIGSQETLSIDVDGGNLGHNELINFRYYDNRLLEYSSKDESVATIDNYGVIYPVSVGETTITVSNKLGISKELSVSIVDGEPIPHYENLSISGSNVCYANDMILDQSSKKNHYKLTPMDGEVELDPEDFIWESSDDLLVRVDKYGVMRGFRKSSNNDENATISAISKLTEQTVTFEVTIKNQLPTSMYYWLIIGDKEVWNPKEYTVCVGDNIKVNIGYSSYASDKSVTIENNEEYINFTNEGTDIILHILKEGSSSVKFTSNINPDLSFFIKFTILKAGAIDTEDVDDVGFTLRKTIGHATLFGIAQIFTLLTFYMFMYDKKIFLPPLLSLGTGLFMSILSEIIQYIEPTRHGTVSDVFINFLGVFIGAFITFGIIIISNIVNRKKKDGNIQE